MTGNRNDRHSEREADGTLHHAENPTAPPDGTTKRSSVDGETRKAAEFDANARPAQAHWPRIAGFELLEELGEGAFGRVFCARQLGLDRLVAIKLLKRAGRLDDNSRQRFLVEAAALGRFDHPNFVQVHSFGEDDDGRPYLAMEFVAGGALRRGSDTSQVDPRAAAQILLTLSRAVAEMHRRHVLHRDLKPGNILVDRSGTLKIGDFGLAKLMDDDRKLTETYQGLGTFLYASPEQISGIKEIDGRSDIYSLGVILYELLSGRLPYDEPTPLRLAKRMQDGPPPPLDKRVPQPLKTICFKCLRIRTKQRYQTADELADDLERYLDRRPILAADPGPISRAADWAARRPLASTLCALILFVSAGGFGYFDTYHRERLEYYETGTYRRGVMEGVRPISRRQAQGREHSFEFVRRGRLNPPRSVHVVNCFLRPTDEFPSLVTWIDGLVGTSQNRKYSRVDFEYKNGTLDREVAYDQVGTPVFRIDYAQSTDSDNAEPWKVVTARYLHTSLKDLTPIETLRVKISRDLDGFDESVRFLRRDDDQSTVNREGVYGYRIRYGDSGLPELIENVDAEGNTMLNKQGIAAVKINRDLTGRERTTTYLGMNKKTPVLCQDGYASMVLEYVEDERGTAELARFLDEEGQPVVNRQLKVVSIVRRYEPDQHRSTLTFLDENGDEVNGPSRFSRLVSQYDDQGLKEWQSNWDQQGVLLGAVIHHYDAEGQLRTTDYFSDEQFSNRMGRHVHEYNQIGRCDSERMFGADGTTLLWSTFREFTQDGRPTKVAHFDGKGDPWRCREGYTQVEYEYRDDGSLAKQVETGYDGSGGFTKIVREFDAENAPTQVRHFNHGVLVEPQNKTPLQSPSG